MGKQHAVIYPGSELSGEIILLLLHVRIYVEYMLQYRALLKLYRMNREAGYTYLLLGLIRE